jgi:hypothetical protein
MTDDDNGQTADTVPQWLGGQGEAAPTNRRQALQLLQRAVTNNWELPDEWKAALPRFCMSIVLDKSKGDRERLRASEILRSMSRDNLDALQILDRIERLENGDATERIELAPIEWNPQR